MASLPFFYCDSQLEKGVPPLLDEAATRHISQVLRMRTGEKIQLTDGKGKVAIAVIEAIDKKKCALAIEDVNINSKREPSLHLAIALTKNTGRNEWLLEKATELGVTAIIPLSAHRSERERYKPERWKTIMVSAMLQSQQSYLPQLSEPQTAEQLLKNYSATEQKLIAHCIDGHPRKAIAAAMQPAINTIVMIGPEGDFTEEEINAAEGVGFTGIEMGGTRLRTETAAMAVCAFFNLINYEKN